MGITRVTRNYQVTLPRDVREMKKVCIGDKFVITVENNEIIMKKIKGKLLERSFGAWKGGLSGVGYARKIRDEAESRERGLKL
ncbi:MAG: AbrB/MazE/SpoVT family DNA-binding domain-containing protein [Candidatus Aenigmarchaeota archaeon]|nr:AbrB/MazE/SpoVT family DNA-binding domain-containing protein [Candidatus Aenigmarchaeota archaeon]